MTDIPRNEPRSHAGHGAAHEPSLMQVQELADFEKGLSARTKVPPERLEEFYAWSEARIRQEVDATARILKRFAEAVVNSMDDATSTNDFLQELDLQTIARDHDWRELFYSLRDQSSGFQGHKRALLVKYLQYLSFRKKLLSFIHAKKAGLDETCERWDPSVVAQAEALQRAKASEAKKHEATQESSKEYVRLILGEPVRVLLPYGRKPELLLAGHLYRLMGTRTPCLVDQNGVMYFLKAGRNMVGRHPECDIIIDPNFRDVSRVHMIIEWAGHAEVTITDLSSRGTLVSAESVASGSRTAAVETD